MMRNLFIAILLLSCISANAQTEDTTVLYRKYPVVPVFSLIKVPDSSKFTKYDLKKKKPVMIMIFSPDCEHCQQETKELLANFDPFKKIQIVMATPLEFRFVKEFYEKYQIADYPNITMGWDYNYLLGTFYHIRNYPSIFIYDKKGNLVQSFEGSVPISKVADAL